MINFHRIFKTCMITVSTPSRIWIQLTNTNSWLFSLDKEYIYNFICGKTVFQQNLKGNGILKLKQGCTVRDDHIVINSHTTVEEKLATTFYPAFNLSDEISVPPALTLKNNTQFTVSFHDHTQELQKIHNQLTEIHQNEGALTRLQPHDIHQYTVGYSALAVSIIIGLGLGIAYYKLHRSRRIPTPAPRVIYRTGLSSDDFKIEVRDFKVGEDVQNTR